MLSRRISQVMPNNKEQEFSGNLLKWANYLKGYRKRWFVLSKGTLSYYRNSKEAPNKCRGSVALALADIHRRNNLVFTISVAGLRPLHIKTKSVGDLKLWISMLEKAKVLGQKNTSDSWQATHNLVSTIDLKIKQLTSLTQVLQQACTILRKELGDVKADTNKIKSTPSDLGALKLPRVLTQLQVTDAAAAAVVKNSVELSAFVNENSSRWHRVMTYEYDQRVRLELMVEDLARQHTELETKLAPSSEDDFFDAADSLHGFSVPLPKPNEFVEEGSWQSDEFSDDDAVNLGTSPVNSSKCEGRVLIRANSSVDNQMSPRRTSLKRRSSIKKPSHDIDIREKVVRRSTIKKRPNNSVNLWSIVKTSIGRDLTRIPIPVNFNEPLSMLQRLTEDYAYSSCLDSADQCTNSLEQLAYVAAFTVSTYATVSYRVNKPFNPLLGETYECDRTDDMGWKSIAEQVSHHPPVSAIHVQSRNWTSWQELSMTSKFRGKYLQVTPLGQSHLKFQRSKNCYTWKKAILTVHNIVFGKMWIDNSGEVEIINRTTGDKCHLLYKPYSYFSSEKPRRVTGSVSDKHGMVHYVLDGSWDTCLEMMKLRNPTGPSVKGGIRTVETMETSGPARELWRSIPQAGLSEDMYNFTELAMQLNEPEKGVAPTDSRLRPDIRLMENAMWDESNKEKMRLEEKQRLARHSAQNQAGNGAGKGLPMVYSDDDSEEKEGGLALEEEENVHQPFWFIRKRDPVTSSNSFVYKGDYWECKKLKKWDRCPSIF